MSALFGIELTGAVARICVIGYYPTRGEIQMLSMMLAGHYDDDIKDGAMLMRRPDPQFVLDRCKQLARDWMQAIFDAANQRQRAELMAQCKFDFKKHNQPHELGTVNELAQRYGVSKSEIRRRKADNTLHELEAQTV
jgi:uncharacterized small protein (DUF1192 family)